VDTLYYLAQAYYLDGQHAPALDTIQRAVAIAPRRAEIAQKYGEYLCEANQCTKGLRYLLNARRLDPTLQNIDFDLGMAYHKQAAVPEAQRYLEAAVTSDPDNLVAARFLADVLGREAQWERATDLYRSVLAREPRNPWALYGLGRASIGLGQYEPAIAPLRAAIDADPTIAEAHFQLAQALRQLGRREDGARELALFTALRGRLENTSPVLHANRSPFEERVWATCQRLVRENREADALAYLAALKTARQPINAPFLLGTLYYTLQRPGDAVRLLTRAVARGSRDAAVVASLGRAYVADRQLEQAEITLARARTLDPQGELSLLGLGELAYARDQWDEAIRFFEQSRTTQVPALLKLCGAYVRAGNRAKALDTAQLVRVFGHADPTSLRELDSLVGPIDTRAAAPSSVRP
jgi:tetratricopeptide (TPR) repeat protein